MAEASFQMIGNHRPTALPAPLVPKLLLQATSCTCAVHARRTLAASSVTVLSIIHSHSPATILPLFRIQQELNSKNSGHFRHLRGIWGRHITRDETLLRDASKTNTFTAPKQQQEQQQRFVGCEEDIWQKLGLRLDENRAPPYVDTTESHTQFFPPFVDTTESHTQSFPPYVSSSSFQALHGVDS